VTAELDDLAVAGAVGAHGGVGLSPLAAIVEALTSRQELLVLDNAEHVVAAVAQHGAGLLANCSGLRVLATSREPVGEVVWPSTPWECLGPSRAMRASTTSA
jgi:predicted ATPase